MSNRKTSLGGEAVRLTASKVITLAISMCTTMLLSRFRTLEEYGTYSQILLVVNLASTLLMLGLPNSINYFLARAETDSEQRKFLSVYYSLSTLLSIVIGIVLVASIPLIEGYFHNGHIRSFYYFLALYPWCSIISSTIENVLIVYQRTKELIRYRLVVSAISLGAVVVVQMLGQGFTVYMIVFISTQCLCTLSVYIIVSRLSGGLMIEYSKDMIKTILVFSLPIGLASVVGTINTEIDKLLIGYLMDTEQMSIYTNAAKELPLTIVASSITAVLLPRLTKMVKRQRIKEAVELWGYAIEIAFIVITVIVFGLITYADEVMTVLYSKKYLPGVGVFRIYTLNLLLRVTYFGIILNAYGETKKILYCSIFSLILNAILNPVFYQLFGMIGPAIATFISVLLILLLQLKMTSSITNISFSKIFPWKSAGSVLLINTFLSIAFFFIKRVIHLELYTGEIIESILLGTTWVALYLIIMRKHLMDRWYKLNSEGY